MFKRSLQLLLFAFVVTCALRAAEDPFVGDWKLDPAQSDLSTKMKVESLGANKYAFDLVTSEVSRELQWLRATDCAGVRDQSAELRHRSLPLRPGRTVQQKGVLGTDS
jgi:hypothetical protein